MEGLCCWSHAWKGIHPSCSAGNTGPAHHQLGNPGTQPTTQHPPVQVTQPHWCIPELATVAVPGGDKCAPTPSLLLPDVGPVVVVVVVVAGSTMASQIAPSPVLRLHHSPGPAGFRGCGLDLLQDGNSFQPTSMIGGGRDHQGPTSLLCGHAGVGKPHLHPGFPKPQPMPGWGKQLQRVPIGPKTEPRVGPAAPSPGRSLRAPTLFRTQKS